MSILGIQSGVDCPRCGDIMIVEEIVSDGNISRKFVCRSGKHTKMGPCSMEWAWNGMNLEENRTEFIMKIRKAHLDSRGLSHLYK